MQLPVTDAWPPTEVFIERFDKVLIKRSYAYKNKTETGYIQEHLNISNPLSCLNHSVAKLQGIAASACG
jgi:hypothetical protein